MKSDWIPIAGMAGVVGIVFVFTQCGKQRGESLQLEANAHIENTNRTVVAHSATLEDIHSASEIARLQLKREGMVCAIAAALFEAERSFGFQDLKDVQIRKSSSEVWLFEFFDRPRSIDSEISIAVEGCEVVASMAGLQPGIIEWEKVFKESLLRGDVDRETTELNRIIEKRRLEYGEFEVERYAGAEVQNGIVLYLAVAALEVANRWGVDEIRNVDGRYNQEGAWTFCFSDMTRNADEEIWIVVKGARIVLSLSIAEKSALESIRSWGGK